MLSLAPHGHFGKVTFFVPTPFPGWGLLRFSDVCQATEDWAVRTKSRNNRSHPLHIDSMLRISSYKSPCLPIYSRSRPQNGHRHRDHWTFEESFKRVKKKTKLVFLRVELDFCFGFVEDPCCSGAGLLPCYLAHQEEKRNLVPPIPALFLMAVAHNLISCPPSPAGSQVKVEPQGSKTLS